MSKYLGSTPFRDLLVHSIAADPTMRAAADALDAAFIKSVRAIPDVLLYARLANDSGFVNPVPMLSAMTRLSDLSDGLAELPGNVLDILAWQLHVEGYEATVDIQAKRELVQGSLLLHRRKGTPWAVKNALVTALRLPTELSEWFSYGGRPYFFRVSLDVTGEVFDATSAANAFRLISEYKNVRSWLDYLETRSTENLYEHVCVGLRSRTGTFTNSLRFKEPAPVSLRERTALALSGITACRNTAIYFITPEPPRQRQLTGVSTGGLTESSLGLWFAPTKESSVRPIRYIRVDGDTKSRIAPYFYTPLPSAQRHTRYLRVDGNTAGRITPYFPPPCPLRPRHRFAVGFASQTISSVALVRDGKVVAWHSPLRQPSASHVVGIGIAAQTASRVAFGGEESHPPINCRTAIAFAAQTSSRVGFARAEQE